MTDFCHLHAHSSFSLLDGLSRPEQMAKRAKELGQPSIAITDHGTMYGAIQFYKACKAAGVKPLIGCEVYVSTRGHTDREHGVDNKSYHLVLLARNKVGYGNLIQLTSKAHLDGFYYKPRVDHALLKEYGGGLVGLSACIGGEVPQAVLNRGMDRARELVTIYQNCFDHFFLEVQHHPEIPEQETANEGILALGKEMGVPVVATNDSHYPCKDDAEAQDALLAIQTQTTLNDTKRMSMLDGDYSLTSTEEMEAHFGQGSELLTNTMAVADLCDLEIELGQGRLPPFETPDDLSSAAYLRQLCEEGLTKRYPIHRSPDSSWAVNEGVSEDEMSATIPEILDRMDFELKIIERMGYEVYFLIVWDFVRFAKENDIVVGPGRGSAAGALVTYALNVTDIDPLKYNLVFERFLNPDRISMPDIDIDFDDENRDRVIEYVRDKYGRDCVASIIVFGTMAAKAAVKDVARVMSLSYDEGDKLAKMIPARPGVSLTEALDESSDFREAFDKDPTSRRVIDLALRLEGVNRHASVHACAIVISEKPLTDYTPLQCAPRGDEVTITQYGAYELEELGLLKMDFLGLRNHTVIKHTVEMVHRQLGVEVDVYNLPEDDGKTYRLFSRGDTTAIFQFESSGMKRYLRELRPTTFEDIMAMVALYRPGPMAFISEFIARKHGRKEIKYDHPLVVPALSNTYGVTVCQEQVMQISREMAGFTRGEADTLRKAMGKKDKDLMLEMEEKFISGAEKNSVPKATAEKIWVDWEEFARYAFNWAHSACYAFVAYQTAYLKAHFPAYFMAATLTSEMDKTDRIVTLLGECRIMGIEMLPPSVNESDTAFTVVDEGIRFGLGAVKNVGRAAIDSILETRVEDGPFVSLGDFCSRVDLRTCNKRIIESLIRAGAFETLEGHRAQLLEGLETAVTSAISDQNDKQRGQISLFGESAPEDVVDQLPELPASFDYEADGRQRVQDEKDLLGFYVSGHPMDPFRTDLESFANCSAESLGESSAGALTMGGIIGSFKELTTKKGKPMAVFSCQDFTGTFEAVVFPETFEKTRELLSEGNMVLLRGTRDADEPKLLVDEVVPIAETRAKMARVVHISISSEELDDVAVETLAELVGRNGGNCSVLVHVETKEVGQLKFKVSGSAVDPNDDLLESLHAIPSVERVWLSENG